MYNTRRNRILPLEELGLFERGKPKSQGGRGRKLSANISTLSVNITGIGSPRHVGSIFKCGGGTIRVKRFKMSWNFNAFLSPVKGLSWKRAHKIFQTTESFNNADDWHLKIPSSLKINYHNEDLLRWKHITVYSRSLWCVGAMINVHQPRHAPNDSEYPSVCMYNARVSLLSWPPVWPNREIPTAPYRAAQVSFVSSTTFYDSTEQHNPNEPRRESLDNICIRCRLISADISYRLIRGI